MPATLAPVATRTLRCDLCGTYWQPEAAADGLACRNTLTVCADADACVARSTIRSELDTLIVTTRERFHVKNIRTYRQR